MTDMLKATHLPIIDAHVHLAGVGDSGSGCHIAAHKFNSLLYKLMRKKLGIYRAHRDGRLDVEYLTRLERDVQTAIDHSALDGAVVFAHDRLYSDNGEVSPARQELYVPNDYLFACCERPALRGRLLPAMSVHPYRFDALDETLRWIERGAAAMKWLPNSQNIDPRDQRCIPIYRALAEHGVPLIAHTGGEHTVTIVRAELGNPCLLQPALDEGVTVILAHCGSKSGLFDTDWLPAFVKLARSQPNCYGDTSAFCTPGRTRWIGRLINEGIARKLIHGSDYPVPPYAWGAAAKLGIQKTLELQRVWSYLERDIRIKRELGMPEEVFTNFARIMPPERIQHLNFAWTDS
jgi:predicted TIM-barrel fold metal-dependent hydrolase